MLRSGKAFDRSIASRWSGARKRPRRGGGGTTGSMGSILSCGSARTWISVVCRPAWPTPQRDLPDVVRRLRSLRRARVPQRTVNIFRDLPDLTYRLLQSVSVMKDRLADGSEWPSDRRLRPLPGR
jgi:hypothetical protein